MFECGKASRRRAGIRAFTERYMVGHAIDIGSGNDPLTKYGDLFPRLRSIRLWDLEDGHAEHLHGMAPNTFDLVHSSHCLEHMEHPIHALARWAEVCRPGGHLVITVPHEVMYEHQVFPSKWNADHKWMFRVGGPFTHKRSRSMLDIVPHGCEILKAEVLEDDYNPMIRDLDQTAGPAECAIELVLRKRAGVPDDPSHDRG